MATPKIIRTFGGVKCNKLIRLVVLGILTSVSSTVFSSDHMDSLVINRIFNYQRDYTPNNVAGFTTNVYTKFDYNVWRRNAMLWLIPSMYSVADGNRSFIQETYSKLKFEEIGKYESTRQVFYSTIRHNGHIMPTLEEFLTPNLYDELIYKDHLLSPFNRRNRLFYSYAVVPSADNIVIVTFKPRFIDNTQLVSGVAIVDQNTGRIMRTHLNGEFDMIKFHTETNQGDEGTRSLLPKNCKTEVEFKFLGNRILATFDAVYDCPITLPDTLKDLDSREMMDSLRPIPLTEQDEYIYRLYDEEHPQTPDTLAVDTIPQKHKKNFFNDVLRHGIADRLVTSFRYEDKHTYFKISPILNPQYLSFSKRRGTAYKIKMGADYFFNDYRYFEFRPWFGYNFKFRKFYFTVPLRFNYNPKRNGYVEVQYGNGNRISHSSIIEEIQEEHGDTLNFENTQLDLFDDNHLYLVNNVQAYDWLEIETALNIHKRKAYDPEGMQYWGKPTSYRSFAPSLSLKLTPWKEGPVLTLDYERAIKGIFNSDIGYERIEMDASYKYIPHPLRKINIRAGSGFYTHKKNDYFVDFTNFRDENLPGGWDDDWTGNFQLLESDWYNSSKYYARLNISYESPLMCVTWFPLLGRYIEKERIYISALSIQHTRPYFELGYGFTNRFFSMGLFTSFLRTHFQEFECKFTFELFRRW